MAPQQSEKEKILELYEELGSGTAVAKRLKISKNRTYKILKESGVLGPRKDEVDANVIVRRYRSGESGQDIADDLGLSEYMVYAVLEDQGVKMRKGGPNPVECPISKKLLKWRYLSGESTEQLAESLGSSGYLVQKWLKEEGVDMRGMTAYGHVDESFFETIDSEEKAYWLGFFAADGSVRDRYAIRVELKEDDIDHVERFAQVINSRSTVKRYERENGYKGCYIDFRSKRMAESLERLGVNAHTKSKDLVMPDIADDLKRHMWRGMIDGDGCISISERYGKQRVTLQITGTQTVCEQFRDYVAEVLDEDASRWTPTDYGTYSSWSIEGDNAVAMIENLYADVFVALDRKLRMAKVVMGTAKQGLMKVTQREANDFFKEHHYLKNVPVACISYGWFDDGVLLAVASFGAASSFVAQASVFGEENYEHVRELRRFAIHRDVEEKNFASKVLGAAIKEFKKETPALWGILTYADASQGHDGTIYRAVGAELISGPAKDQLVIVLPNGERLTGRQDLIVQSIKSRGYGPEECTVEFSKGKYKYVILVGNQKQRNARKALLEAENS